MGFRVGDRVQARLAHDRFFYLGTVRAVHPGSPAGEGDDHQAGQTEVQVGKLGCLRDHRLLPAVGHAVGTCVGRSVNAAGSRTCAYPRARVHRVHVCGAFGRVLRRLEADVPFMHALQWAHVPLLPSPKPNRLT